MTITLMGTEVQVTISNVVMLTSVPVICAVSIHVWSAKENIVLELKQAESLNVSRHIQFFLHKVSPFPFFLGDCTI